MTVRKGWARVPIASLYSGLYDGPHGTPPVASEGPIFLGIGNITEDGHLDLSTVRHIAPEDFPKWTKRVLPKEGDIVFTYEATLNRYAIIPKNFHGCLGRRLALIRPDPEKVDTRFLHYSFFSRDWRATIEQNRLSGATVDRVPLSKFPTFPINVPELPVQRRIAEILSAYDDLIEINQRRIAILEQMGRLLFDEWFVRFRYPGHETVRLVETELGMVPEGWHLVRAEQFINFDPRTKVPKEGLKRFVAMSCLATASSVISEWETRSGNSGSKFQNGDTLMARITPCLENGKTGLVNFLDADEAAFGSTEFTVMRGNGVPPSFVYLLARSEGFRTLAIKSMSGADGRQRVRTEALKGYLIARPPTPLLHSFAANVEPVFAQVRNLADQNAHLGAARDLLLPKLLSGELEFGNAELAFAEAAE